MKKIIFILGVLVIVSCKSNTYSGVGEKELQKKKIAIIIHGGAGGIQRKFMSEKQQQQYEEKLKEALNDGYKVLEKGGSSMEAVQKAIVTMEDSPLFNAGKGAVYNSEGKQEMDASIMNGKTLNSGAVAGVAHIKNPILAARIVMDSSRHVMLSGKGAEILVQKYGVKLVDSSYFFSEKRLFQLKKVQEKEREKAKEVAVLEGNPFYNDHKYGTVGAVAIDQTGTIVAGTSTGGLTNKKYGRIGDSPIIGAGTYANNKTCGISSTGTGEFFIRTVAAHEVSNLIQYKNYSPKKALNEVIFNQIGKLNGDGGMILLDPYGNGYWDFNTKGMFRAYKNNEGVEVVKMFEKEK